MHPIVLKSSQLILAGDIAGAEHALVEIADQQGEDHGEPALGRALDEDRRQHSAEGTRGAGERRRDRL